MSRNAITIARAAASARTAAAASSLLAGLVDGWRLEEALASANRVGVKGTLLAPAGAANPGSGAGWLGNGATFGAATTSRLEISPLDTTSFSPGMGSFSLRASVNFTAVGADRVIASKYKATTGGFEWRLYYQTAGPRIRFQIVNDSAGSTTSQCDSPAAFSIAASQWVHAVATWNVSDQKQRLYLNGRLVATTSANAAFASSGIFPGSGNFMLGNLTGSSNSANGTLDEVFYWSRALTDTEAILLTSPLSPLGYPFNRAPIGVARAAA